MQKSGIETSREWIRTEFENQAEWRSETAGRWNPRGSRDQTAVKLLHRLAATVSEIRAANLERLDRTFDANPDIMLEWKIHLRFVGFRTFPESADEFIEEFLDSLRVKVERPTLKIVR